MNLTNQLFKDQWGIILGGSSGFGLASIEKLVAGGMNIAVLYREMAASERELKEKFNKLAEQYNVAITPFNMNALEDAARKDFIQRVSANTGQGKVTLLLHSIARGNLKPLVTETNEAGNILSVEDIQLTTYAMATSLLDWTRDLLTAGLFAPDARIIGLTSEGAHKYWDSYAAVSIAKASLESLATYMAVEMAKYGLKTNVIQAGVTETPSLKRIPGSDALIEMSEKRNPLGRMTTPADVADVVHLLCTPEAKWINGSLIHVDGGEHCR